MPIARISWRGASGSPTSCGGPPRAPPSSRREELREGGARLQRFVADHRPAVVAIAGVTAYRDAFGERGAALGRQPDTLDSATRWSGAALWVVPNPSGLNAHETVATLAAAYAAPAAEAGVIAR